MMRLAFAALLAMFVFPPLAPAFGAAGDIVFVTQVPQADDFATIGSTFANHSGSIHDAPRGGDLYIRYANGTLKNLTRAAGYGVDGFQGATSIAVRDPAVHWSGTKVLFSMVIGSATHRYEYNSYYWQLYEITGLQPGETPVITKIPNQPENYNNVMPTYSTDDLIIFSTDRPRNGERHLYPQRDEYESTRTNSGLWRLNPGTGELILLDHAPSGVFNPFVDSFGRIIYTRWDHLQRDQQASNRDDYGAFNYLSEAADAGTRTQVEYFPEARSENERTDVNLNLHTINQFFPWQINEDGTDHETLNHIGRHELLGYFDRSFNNDANLEEYYGQYTRTNPRSIQNFFEIREDPLHLGTYYGVNAPEFQTHAAGQLVKLSGPPTLPADQIVVDYVTHRDTSSTDDTPSADHSGLYRNPLPLTTGTLVAVHTSETREDRNDGTLTLPTSRYQFRLKTLHTSNGYQVPNQVLTTGIVKAVSYWNPDELININAGLWELQPVELVARARPASRRPHLETPELTIFQQEGVDVETFKSYLRENSLALIVSRNLTSRDAQDIQQPFNLRVSGGGVANIPAAGKVYDISHLQLFQGDQLRGYDGADSPSDGRRVLAVPMHSGLWANAPASGGPASSVKIAADGSVAAFVPARRALSWQTTAADGSPVVRERYWLTFQPGEVRVCASCHGLNSHDQSGAGVPQNAPEALRVLLRFWRDQRPTPPNNPDDPNLPPTPTPSPNPQYAMSFASTKKKNSAPGVLMSGWTGRIFAGGTNAESPSKSVSLYATVEGIACGAPIATRVADPNGNLLLSGKVPSAKRNLTVGFQLNYLNASAATANVMILNGKSKQSAKALKAKEIAAVCKALRKFR